MKNLNPITFETDDIVDDFRPKVVKSDPKAYSVPESVDNSPPEKLPQSLTTETESNKSTENSIQLIAPQELKSSLSENSESNASAEKDQKEN